jgi:hypothetical protein
METFGNNKSCNSYHCQTCDYKTCRKSSFNKHLATDKHKTCNFGNIGNTIETEKLQKVAKSCKQTEFTCNVCSKMFKSRGGFWKHMKTCQNNTQTIQYTPPNSSDNEIVKTLIKQNEEFKELIVTQNKQIIELAKTAGNNTITHTNSHNKTFNLQVFLNETCKDAMNITDFVKSLQLNLQDLEKVGELGYAEGISRIMVSRLNDLEVTKRPIHCSDAKREIIHIKDKDVWEKDNANQDKLRNAIKQVSNKNVMLLDDWRKENPGCTNYDDRRNDMYLKMQVESMGPADEVNEKRDFGKIIRTIAKHTIIDKEIYNMHQ